MKKSTTRRLLMLALCLTLVSCTLIGGTLAKYTSSFEGTGNMTAATWSASLTVNNTGVTESKTLTLPTDKMYPGMNAISIPVKVVNNSDTVDAEAIVTITIGENAPTNMTFKFGDANSENAFTSGSAMNAYAVAKGEAGVTKNLLIEWSFGADADDTADQGKTVSIKIEVTINQTTGKAQG